MRIHCHNNLLQTSRPETTKCITLQFCMWGLWHSSHQAKMKVLVVLGSFPEALGRNLLVAYQGWRQNSVPSGCRAGGMFPQWLSAEVVQSFKGFLHSLVQNPLSLSTKPAMANQVPQHFDSFLLLPSSRLCDHFFYLLFQFKEPGDYIGPLGNPACSPCLRSITLIPSAKFLLSFNIILSQIAGNKTWIFSGHCSAYHRI